MSSVGTIACERQTADSIHQRERYVAALAEQARSLGLDYMVTCTFSERKRQQLDIRCPEKMVAFARQRLIEAGYFGPYLLVVHDKFTGYWHPHVLIQDQGRFGQRVEAAFEQDAQLGRKKNGPLTGDAYLYCARRAVERWPDVDYCWIEPSWKKRGRPRGRRRNNQAY